MRKWSYVAGDIFRAVPYRRYLTLDEDLRRQSEVAEGLPRDQGRTKDMVEETRNLNFGKADIRRER